MTTDIELGRFGRIVDGEPEGYFLHLSHDVESAGGDGWALDLAHHFRVERLRIEWLDRFCTACSAPGAHRGTPADGGP